MLVMCRPFWYCLVMNHYIYYVRSGPNEELRYSLRSLAVNAPEGRVTIIGDPPPWVNRNVVNVVPGNRYGSLRFQNSLDNIRIASELEPGDYYTMNDDFLLLEPWPEPFPLWYWRPVSLHIETAMKDPRSAPRKAVFRRTLEYLRLRGIEDPNHFELHIPMKINGTEMLRILDEASDYINLDNPPIWRTLYGNLSSLEGEPVQREDVKRHILPDGLTGLDFLSTDELTFSNILPYLKDLFPEPSPWEL